MATKKRKRTPRRQEPVAPPTAAPGGDTHEGIKDTTESIVVAFILAFVFRTFMIEAFVIPTGSMAATLYGQHGAIVCEDCGMQNDYGLTDLATRAPRYGSENQVRCQNCNHLNSNLTIHDGARSRTRPGQPTHSNAEAGDRILVHKWPFDFGAEWFRPQRWDVTVFKNPAAGDENSRHGSMRSPRKKGRARHRTRPRRFDENSRCYGFVVSATRSISLVKPSGVCGSRAVAPTRIRISPEEST